MEKVHLNSVVSPEETSSFRGLPTKLELDGVIAQRESQSLWSTGKLSEPIPDGFYFITPERRFMEFYESIPSLDELQYLDSEGFGPNVILVDTNKDKKLLMLKQLALTLVKGLNSSPMAVIKKIAGLVSDFYKSPNLETNNAKGGLEEVCRHLENHGIHLLCQLKHGSCQSRAILFKVLADSVGIDSKLMVGLPREGVMEQTDSYKHMSVTVFLDSVEFLVDLARVPGKLTPCTSEAVFFSHMVASHENESAGNSYDSPMEPCSPLCGFPGQADLEGGELEEFLQPSYQSKLEASFSGASVRSVLAQSKVMAEQKLK